MRRNKISYRIKLLSFSVIAISFLFGILCSYAYFLSGLRVVSSPHKINWRQHPAVVLESDDWGASMLFGNLEKFNRGASLLPIAWQESGKFTMTTLESPDDLERLFSVLLRHVGADGLPAVFSANYVMYAPDYRRIRDKYFSDFYALKIPSMSGTWTRGDFIAVAKEGMSLGVWNPEYHGMLHMNPYKWMEILRESDDSMSRLFDLESYALMTGGPLMSEYAINQDTDQQRALIKKGITAFTQTFGNSPHCSIAPFYVWQTRTEKLLTGNGIKTIKGKNLQSGNKSSIWNRILGKMLNTLGYKSADKPWQIQMGDINANLGLAYLLRNVVFEPLILQEDNKIRKDLIKEKIKEISTAWSRNEPAVVITHRFNYVSLEPSVSDTGRTYLDSLLEELKLFEPKVVFLTDWEVAQHYLYGYSIRFFGDKEVIRNFSSEAKMVQVVIPKDMHVTDVLFVQRGKSTFGDHPTRNQIYIPAHTTCVIGLAQISKSNMTLNLRTDWD